MPIFFVNPAFSFITHVKAVTYSPIYLAYMLGGYLRGSVLDMGRQETLVCKPKVISVDKQFYPL